MNNEWKTVKECVPEKENFVLVWRIKRKKYCVAKIQTIDFGQDGGLIDCWVTEHSNIHDMELEDMWFPFPNIKIKYEI